MKKIGIFGGSFDPIHNGHIELAKWALIEKNLDFVFFMPTKKNPFKKDNEIAKDEDRVNMIKLILVQNDYFCLSEKELSDKEYSYSYDTLLSITQEYKDCEIYFIVGTDSICTMEEWYKGDKLLSEFNFITCFRPGHSKDEFLSKIEYYKKKYNAKISLITQSMPDISSTEIKKRIKEGTSISDLVPADVERYILENDLYR